MSPDLISIGGARLRGIGLKPIRIARRSEVRVPGTPVFYDMDYQETGLGERTTHLSVETLPHLLGGMDALAILEGHHLARAQVSYIRLAANLLALNQGQVIIRSLDVDEEQLHPADGVGRIVRAEIELLHVSAIGRPFGASA